MTPIEKLISTFESMLTQSETEVRTKFVIPLFELLGYSVEVRAEEFPVYGHEGGRAISAKSADIIYFNDNEFARYRSRLKENINWVCEHSLLVVEIKKRGESIEVEGQAIYYAAWTRCPLYVITNGEEIVFYRVNSNFSDEMVLKCSIKDIVINWEKICGIYSYDKALIIKDTSSNLKHNFIDDRYDVYCNKLLIRLDAELVRATIPYITKKKNDYFTMQLANEANRKIEYRQVLKQEENMIIISDPGGGKTYLMSIVAREYLSHNSYNTKIPIIIKGEYFRVFYNSLEEEVFRQINRLNSDCTLQAIKKDIQQGKFIFLFDGLDEVKKEKEVVIELLREIIISTDNIVIITSRKDNYSAEFENICELYQIAPLEMDIINEYIKKNTQNNISLYNLRLDQRFVSLLQIPLFLFLTVEILNNIDGFKLPANKSKLYELYFKYVFKGKTTAIQIVYIEKILAKYAQYLIYNSESDEKLLEIIEEITLKSECEKYYALIIASGILVHGDIGLKFYHYTFLEYFYALQLAKYKEEEIITFLEGKYKEDKYFNIICLMVGIISDSNKQNIILDYLEEKDLKIYIRAVQSRFKFNKEIIDKEYRYSNEYFAQVRKTYLALINTYFIEIKNDFYPYNKYVGESGSLKIFGSIDYKAQGISIEFDLVDHNEEMVEVRVLNQHPQVYYNNQEKSIPIFSINSSDGYYYFNLNLLSYGLDSSREIALQLIESQVKNILKKEGSININRQSPAIMAEFIEDNLRYLKNHGSIPEEIKYISLYRNTYEVYMLFYQNKEKVINRGNPIQPKIIPVSLLAYYSLLLKDFGQQIDKYLLVKGDVDYTTLDKKSYTYLDLYTDNQILKAIKQVLALINISYRSIVEGVFKNLSERLDNYYNYIQVAWIERDETGEGISIFYIKTIDFYTEPIVFINEKAPSYDKAENVIKPILIERHIEYQGITHCTNSILYPYLQNGIVQDTVYKLLKEDFEDIFKNK